MAGRSAAPSRHRDAVAELLLQAQQPVPLGGAFGSRQRADLELEPGDVIATGTPAGVGIGFSPPKFLQPGDMVRIEVSAIGVLENPVA